MKSWLAGFLAFGFAYTAFVVAIHVYDWPTFESPHLYGTLEADLTDSASESVLKAFNKPSAVTETSVDLYVVRNDSYEMEDDTFTATIVLANGHVLVLKPNTPPETAVKVADEYVGLVNRHVERITGEHKARMFMILLIPLVLLTLFAFFARWLWNKLLKLD